MKLKRKRLGHSEHRIGLCRQRYPRSRVGRIHISPQLPSTTSCLQGFGEPLGGLILDDLQIWITTRKSPALLRRLDGRRGSVRYVMRATSIIVSR